MRLEFKILQLVFCLFIFSDAYAQMLSRDLLLSSKYKRKFNKRFSRTCEKALRSFYKDGNRLVSKYVQDRLVRLEEFGRDDNYLERTRKNITKLQDGFYTFYHYTRREKPFLSMFEVHNRDRDKVHKKLVNEDSSQTYSDITRYLKFSTYDSFQNRYIRSSGGVFYVSSCPTCSDSFGHVQISFTLDPATKVFQITDSYNWWPIEREIRQNYRILNSCSFSEVDLFVLEDSGVDLMKYSSSWYQFLNLDKIINSDIATNVFRNSDYAAMKLQQTRTSYTMHRGSSVGAYYPNPPSSIRIYTARWFFPEEKFRVKYINKALRKLCDGRRDCEFLADENIIESEIKLRKGRSSKLKNSYIEITFQCGQNPPEKRLYTDEELYGTRIKLDCTE